ncbi:MAG: AAA family ATPase [Deltaproteobacteria bacterium]|jgi:hypothetical protein|nr:AAA family ATPase [Deltaproteobacteria bacterium]
MDADKKLPVGYDDFATIVRNNCIFADKTDLIYKIINTEALYFLSRPRRFGKTLLLSVIEAIFEGCRELFKGLWIYDQPFDWTPRQVIHIKLYSANSRTPDTLETSLADRIKRIADMKNIQLNYKSSSDLFAALIEKLSAKKEKNVVVLIDEYDAPILAHIENKRRAEEIRATLSKFYGVLKETGKYVRFGFITGVTRFSKTSLFSGLNNLNDITLDKSYANILGFTIDEFNSLFQKQMEKSLPELITAKRLKDGATLEDLKSKLFAWYDGYSWDGKTRTLNPWSVILFFDKNEYAPFWYESGTPTFLKKLIVKRRLDLALLKQQNAYANAMGYMDIGDKLDVRALLFQTGYLTIGTIDAQNPNAIQYYPRFPNLEVEASLIPLFLLLDNSLMDPFLLRIQAKAMLNSITRQDSSGFESAFESLLSQIPFDLHFGFEAYYNTIFLFAMSLAEQHGDAQGSVGDGKFDFHIRTSDGNDYIIEIKYVKLSSSQLKLPASEKRTY